MDQLAKIKVLILFVLLLLVMSGTLCGSYAIETKKEDPLPSCSATGEISCPKGFKPSCPKPLKPSCVFLANRQRPSCLADSTDGVFFDYHLDKITCKK